MTSPLSPLPPEEEVPYLLVLNGARSGDVVPLQAITTIGSGEAADLHLPDDTVSREHARIVQRSHGWLLANLHSAQGTHLNRRPVTHPVRLQEGDKIGVTDVELLFFSSRARLTEAARATQYRRATRDPLTGVHTRQYLAEQLTRELSFARRHCSPVALMLVCPQFREPAADVGDGVMRALSRRLHGAVRPSDVWARYSRNVLVLMCRATSAYQAQACGQRLRKLVATTPIRLASPDVLLSAIINVGIAIFAGTSPAPPDTLLALAEKALSRAQSAGGNDLHLLHYDDEES